MATAPGAAAEAQGSQRNEEPVLDFLLRQPGVEGQLDRLLPEALRNDEKLHNQLCEALSAVWVCSYFKGHKEPKKNGGLHPWPARDVCAKDLRLRYGITLQHPDLPCIAVRAGDPFRSFPVELCSINHTKKRVLPQPYDREILMRPPIPVHELLQEQQQQQQAQHQLQDCQVAPHGRPTSTSAVSMHPSANLFPDSIRNGFGGFLDALTPSDEEERRSRAAVNKVNTALHKAALKGADWNVEGAAKAAGSHGRKTHLRGSHDIDLILVLHYPINKGPVSCTSKCLAACWEQLEKDGWEQLPCKRQRKLTAHHPADGLYLDLVPIPAASALLRTQYTLAGLPEPAATADQLPAWQQVGSVGQQQAQLLDLLTQAQAKGGANAATVLAPNRDMVNALTHNYMALWQQYSSPAESSGNVNKGARAFKAWVKHGLCLGNGARDSAGFPGMVAEILAIAAWRETKATHALPLFVAMLDLAATHFRAGAKQPLLLTDFYSLEQALSFREDWWADVRPYIIHPVSPNYNITAHVEFVDWQTVAEAAGKLRLELQAYDDWPVLLQHSTLGPAVHHFCSTAGDAVAAVDTSRTANGAAAGASSSSAASGSNTGAGDGVLEQPSLAVAAANSSGSNSNGVMAVALPEHASSAAGTPSGTAPDANAVQPCEGGVAMENGAAAQTHGLFSRLVSAWRGSPANSA